MTTQEKDIITLSKMVAPSGRQLTYEEIARFTGYPNGREVSRFLCRNGIRRHVTRAIEKSEVVLDLVSPEPERTAKRVKILQTLMSGGYWTSHDLNTIAVTVDARKRVSELRAMGVPITSEKIYCQGKYRNYYHIPAEYRNAHQAR